MQNMVLEVFRQDIPRARESPASLHAIEDLTTHGDLVADDGEMPGKDTMLM